MKSKSKRILKSRQGFDLLIPRARFRGLTVRRSARVADTVWFIPKSVEVIEVPEKGKARQFGRFNQGGTLNIFADQQGQYKNAA